MCKLNIHDVSNILDVFFLLNNLGKYELRFQSQFFGNVLTV